MEECRALIDVSPSQIMTSADFPALVPTLGEAWSSQYEAELRGILTNHLGHTSKGANPFDLAMGMFFCTGSCGRALLRYPEILAHGCTRKLRPAQVKERYNGDFYALAAVSHRADPAIQQRTWDTRWDGSYGPFDLACIKDEKATKRAMGAMKAIVTALGLDPATASFEELQSCKTRLVCDKCKEAGGAKSKFVYGWEAAVSVPFKYTRE